MNASIYVNTEKGVSELPRLMALRSKYRGKRLRADGVKIFADGVLETRTAAVLEPYIGFGDDRGKANLKPADFQALATALDKEGFQIHIHAIGDRGIRDSLDALEAAEKANGRRDARHHVAHLELIEPPDIPRFRRLGVVANFQPFWANGDQYITELTEPELGPERSRWLYPIASVLAAGGVTAFGSDWSVSSMNPLDGIEVAVTHREPPKGPGPAWLPQEQIALPEAIAGYTIGGAYLDFTREGDRVHRGGQGRGPHRARPQPLRDPAVADPRREGAVDAARGQRGVSGEGVLRRLTPALSRREREGSEFPRPP